MSNESPGSRQSYLSNNNNRASHSKRTSPKSRLAASLPDTKPVIIPSIKQPPAPPPPASASSLGPLQPSKTLSYTSKRAKLHDTDYARKVFDRMPQRNIVHWTAIIWCYSNAGDMRNAFLMYNSMHWEGILPSSITILNLLTGLLDSRHVDVLHTCIVKSGYRRDVVLTNCLLNVYTKHGRLKDARELFESLDEKDVVSWNSLINAYSVVGNVVEVLKVFIRMRIENTAPDRQTFGSLASTVEREGGAEVGKVQHGLIVSSGFEYEKHVETSLVSFYSRCRMVDEALRILEHLKMQSWPSIFFLAGATWCVCKQSLDNKSLQKTLDYACGAGADCQPTHANGPCFNPDTVRDHCSYAVNSYFQKNRQAPTACDFSGTASVVTSDPNAGTSGCTFPATASAAATPTNGSSSSLTTTSNGAFGGTSNSIGPSGYNDGSHGGTRLLTSIILSVFSVILTVTEHILL